MVKSILTIAAIFAIGCSLPPSHPVASSNKEAAGHNDIIDWKCSQKDYSDFKVSVKCNFKNFSPSSFKKKVCIAISFADIDDGAVASKTMCSEPMADGDSSSAVIPFDTTDILGMIQACGHHNEYCHLMTVEDNL